MRWALESASAWVTNPRCRALFTEFRDEAGRPLTARLAELEIDEVDYLSMILFRNGDGTRQCDNRDRTIMYTMRGHRVVFVCERQFLRMYWADQRRAKAMVIHEVLHTLGLGENPPSSEHITRRVLDECGF
jgi:hypothetical protein